MSRAEILTDKAAAKGVEKQPQMYFECQLTS